MHSFNCMHLLFWKQAAQAAQAAQAKRNKSFHRCQAELKDQEIVRAQLSRRALLSARAHDLRGSEVVRAQLSRTLGAAAAKASARAREPKPEMNKNGQEALLGREALTCLYPSANDYAAAYREWKSSCRINRKCNTTYLQNPMQACP
jgi:hypothetical protein